MGKKRRRTKKDKIIAQLRRRMDGEKTGMSIGKNKLVKPNKNVVKNKMIERFTYDPKLIISDLRKTAVMSLVILGLELGLWIYFS